MSLMNKMINCMNADNVRPLSIEVFGMERHRQLMELLLLGIHLITAIWVPGIMQ